MTTEEMGRKILEHIRRYGDASFAELMTMFGDEAEGDRALEIWPNAILWSGMSQALIDALDALKQQIELRGASIYVYIADGRVLDMPVARSLPKEGLKEPRWVPMVLKLRRGLKGSRNAVLQWRSH